jgi:hypothetical protein
VSTAVALAVEILTCQPENVRATKLFAALAAARPHGVTVAQTQRYRGGSEWLMLWGPGAPERAEVMRQHVAAGGHAIVWDLAYWQRDVKARVSIDAAHPQAWVMRRDWPASRLAADLVPPVSHAWNPRGPVVVAGIGDKARVQYGAGTVDAWERSMIVACRERWPDRQVVYRKKKVSSPEPSDVCLSSPAIPIEQALRGASLVVTWHSNVAVDAIRLGIPAVCRDGAAAAVCPSALDPVADPAPLPDAVRDRFLANLSWFQWAPSEAQACWAFLEAVLA